ncbi:hypothetical protein POI25_000874 [Salmonella enterica]|nr:hypothetical protein [Salmonella enterica]EBP4190560.1 hypothetical protein [Salmonella enterica subsp. enterica]ECF6082169.1 hypothetical protein [Salmonella enterica subsp. houtenae]EHD0024541.1 hypothetical protein [Salmonella enterica subsp. houtenae serovar 50:g,z51:-]EAP1211692.1 hypothetical protein [Salmonella enterica]
MSKDDKMDVERSPWKFIIIFIIRYFIALTMVLYLVRLGTTALAGIKTGTFNFDYRDDFFASLKDGLFFGIIFGIGEWAIRKAKKFDKNKKNDRNK